MTMSIAFEEEERQATLLALAELALSRPGWNDFLGGVAAKMNGVAMFEHFKITSGDVIKPRALWHEIQLPS